MGEDQITLQNVVNCRTMIILIFMNPGKEALNKYYFQETLLIKLIDNSQNDFLIFHTFIIVDIQ